MPTSCDSKRLVSITAKLGELGAGDRSLSVFGSSKHGYELHSAVTATRLGEFESEHCIELPSAYRAFLGEVCNGPVGPSYGLSPLEAWSRRDPINGKPSAIGRPFPLRREWLNTTEPRWTRALHDGCLHLCEGGCGYFSILVVNGPAAGQVWSDTLAVEGGGSLTPVSASFLDWYEEWLDRSLVDWAVHQIVVDVRDPDMPRNPRLLELTADGVGGHNAFVHNQRLGYRRLYGGDIEGARVAFARASDEHPARGRGVPAIFYQMMCDLHRLTGDEAARLEAAEVGAARSPYATRVRLLWEKVDVLFRTGRTEQALEALIERSRCSNVNAVVEAVAALRQYGRDAAAEQILDRVRTLPSFNPRWPERHQRLLDALAEVMLPPMWRSSVCPPK